MEEIEFSKEIIKIVDSDILQTIVKKATEKGFTVQGFSKNVWLAPKMSICAAVERGRRGRYQSSIFLEALSEIKTDDKVINLAKKWLWDKPERDQIEQEIEQIRLEKTENKRKEIIIKEKSVSADINKEKCNDTEKNLQQIQVKNKKLQNMIQNLRIDIENQQKEISQLQKKNSKLENKFMEKESENSELQDEISNLKKNIKQLESKLDLYKQENLNYQEKFKKAPKILCFSKKDIDKECFPFYNVKQLYKWVDEYKDTVKWNEYKEVWVIETDFNYSEIVKMKKLSENKIILKRNIKSLMEKVRGI